MNHRITQAFDVCIVGGGIVGTALAASLSSSPFTAHLKVALVEAGNLYSEPEIRPANFSNRVASVTPASMRLLNRIGAWDRIPADRKKAYTQMKVWDASANGAIAFNAPMTHSASSIGWIIENDWLKSSLAQSLSSSVTVFNSSVVAGIESPSGSGSDWPVISVNSDKGNGPTVQLKSRLLVGADGVNSLVRKYAGIESIGWDYPQKAVAATLEIEGVEGNKNDVAYQRFLPTGPIALLPLAENKSSLVWSASPAIAAKLLSLSAEDFAIFVDVAFRNPIEDLTYLLSRIQPDGSLPKDLDLKAEAVWGQTRLETANTFKIGVPPSNTSLPRVVGVAEKSRAAFPLRFYLSDRYVSDHRVALVGDAAHTVHPLAGQGLNLGLLDVATLTNVIEEGVQAGADIGNIHTLQGYAAERFAPNLGMMMAIDSIGKLFRAESDPVVWARSFGLNLVNTLPGFKNLAMKAASTL
ncbi:putative ubiquinone biosynthesis monooxygenase [Chytriomyces hyalinus]|nr:putative ubiquinone biosynthesis monooxygenase [Chytriomyces hyalinus]